MPVRCTLLISVTTQPAAIADASAHSGGWSESFWIGGSSFQTPAFFQTWAQSRANLLSGLCAVIGYRQQLYTISVNKLLPGGSGSGSLLNPGSFGADLSAPQDALMLNFAVNGQPQPVRHRLAGLPGSQISNGEYQPNATYKGNVTKYVNLIASLGFSAVVRDLTQQEARVRSLAGASLTTNTATGTAVGGYIRFRRVKDSNNRPVEGTFNVTAVVANADGSTTYTLNPAPGQTVSTPSGTCRNDLLAVAALASGSPNRLVVRKVGRPFVQYRGRRSKRF